MTVTDAGLLAAAKVIGDNIYWAAIILAAFRALFNK